MSKQSWVCAVATWFGLSLVLQAQEPVDVTVLVYRDANGNGRRDEGEAGLGGVVVSDEVTVARTDAEGHARFRCDMAVTRFCYASIPEDSSLRSSRWRLGRRGNAALPERGQPVRADEPSALRAELDLVSEVEPA